MLHRRRKLSSASSNPAALELSDWNERGNAEVPKRRAGGALGPVWRRLVDAASRLGESARIYLTRQYARHGSHISRHQTRTLLLCHLVIASLFYPAVVMYLLTTSEDASASFTPECLERHRVGAESHAACIVGARAPTNIWDVARTSLSDITGDGRVQRSDESYAVHDLRLVWDETPSLEVVPRPTHAEGVPSVRMAQVLITTEAVRRGRGSPYGMLEPHALLTAQRMQSRLEAQLRASDVSCVELDGRCLVLSPLSYWPRAEDVHGDWHPAKSFSGSPVRAVVTPPVAPLAANTTIPLLYSTTLASRWPYLPLFSRAEFLVLTFFLHDTPGAGAHWQEVVAELAHEEHAALSVPAHVAAGDTYLRVRRWLTQFKPQYLTARPTLNISVVAGGYMTLLLFIFRGLVQMRRLHSRFGIAFTGSVQLLLDLIMSLSVCALLGIRLTAVPWSILPFIIVVVGSESMLFMIRTITNTPLSLTVHARIAYGLSQVAGPITLTALSDIVLLVLLASTVRIPAVLQFCLFTICTLVVDYFMQMTFFVTVLSIDMQRLELAEVLLQGASAPSAPAQDAAAQPAPHQPYRPRSAISYVMHGLHAVWRMRSVRSFRVSLLATVVLTTVFYFASDGKVGQLFARLAAAPFSAPDVDADAAAHAVDGSAYGALWSAINPARAALVRVSVEPWALVTLPATPALRGVHTPPGPWLEQLFFHRQGATLLLIFLFVVAPIAGTMLIMSFVLRYLRKDADRLESQHEDSDGTDTGLNALLPTPSRAPPTSLRVHVEALADALHPAPLHLVCADGAWTASADICNTLRVARADAASLRALATLRADARAAPDGSRVLAMGVRDDGEAALVAVGQASGRVAVLRAPAWELLAEATDGPDGALAPVQHVGVHGDTLLTLHRDGQWLAWADALRVARGAAGAPLVAHALTPRRASGAWTSLPLDGDAELAAVSAQGDVALARVVDERVADAGVRAAAEPLVHGMAPALCRCAVLLAGDAEETPAPSRGAPGPVPPTPPRSGVPARRAPWLVAGDQRGALHLWAEPGGAPAATLALAEPRADGAVLQLQRVRGASAPMLVATTANRVWFVGVCVPAARLELLGSVENVRGVADVLPHAGGAAPAWVLGVRRAAVRDEARAARWEVWRMRLPSWTPGRAAELPGAEPLALPLEQLIGAGIDARLTDASAEPPARRPLLAARLDRMVRVGTAGAAWVLPFGSCLVTISTT